MASAASNDITIKVPYFQIEQTVASSRYQWSCHDRGDEPFVILQWTQSGEGTYEDEHGPRPVPAGHAFVAVVPERSTYYYAPTQRDPWVFTWLNFYGPLANGLMKQFQAEFGPVVPLALRGAAAAALRRLLTTAGQDAEPDRSRISLQAYAFLLEWWREASQPSGGAESGLARAIRFCREHFREPLGVKQLAQEAGMSREHFSRVFQQRMNESPGTFLRGLRVNEATMLLRETTLPLREISMRCGFYSAQHLMRTFQRLHGITPSEYRRGGNKEA
jgi:AraC-like DNA-binding protein